MMSLKYSQLIPRHDFLLWVVENEHNLQNCQFHGKGLNLVPPGAVCFWKGKGAFYSKEPYIMIYYP
jgi:hypothetical protein